MVRRVVFGNKYLYYSGVLIVSFMAFTVSFISNSLFYLLPVFVLLLPMMKRESNTILLSAYLLIALSVFYTSLCIYLIPLLFLLAPIVVKSFGNYFLSKHELALSGFGSLSLSVTTPMKFLIVSSLVALLNYHVGLSISVFVLSLLSYSLYRYLGLLRVSLTSVEYPDKIYLGSSGEIRISVSSRSRVLLSVSYGVSSEVFWVENNAVLRVSVEGNVIGRKELMLRIVVYDDSICVRRVLAELPVVIHVVPSYERLLEYSRKNILARIDVKQVLEPVEAKAYFIGGEEGVIEVSGPGELVSLLAGLPLYVRSLLRGLLGSYFERVTYRETMGRRGRGGMGKERAVLGEYYGTRIFVPGDKLRAVHWKKTVSRRRLYVKEYISGSSSDLLGVSGRRGPVIILDLGVRGSVEFDRVVKEFLRLLVFSSTRNPFVEASLVVVAGSFAVFLRGKLVDVLNAFTNVLLKSSPKLVYEYESFSTNTPVDIVDDMIRFMNESSLISLVSYPCINYSRRIMRLLVENNVLPGRNVAIIHGSPTALKNAFLRYFLENSGYSVEVMGVVNE